MAGFENDNNNNESEDDFGNQNLEDKNAYKTIDLDDEMKRIIALRGKGKKPKTSPVTEYPQWPPVCDFNTSSSRTKRDTWMKKLEESAINYGGEWIGISASRNPTRFSIQQFTKGNLALKLAQTQEYENLAMKWVEIVMEEQRKRRETEEWQENRRKSNEAAKLARLKKQQEKAAKEKAAKEKRIEKQQETAEKLASRPGINSTPTLEKLSIHSDGTKSPNVLNHCANPSMTSSRNENLPISTSEHAKSNLNLNEENEQDNLTENPPIETSPVNDYEQLDDFEPELILSTSGEEEDSAQLIQTLFSQTGSASSGEPPSVTAPKTL